jgi:hypothetical protein
MKMIIEKLDDGKYKLVEPLKLKYGMEIPKGFITDGMSSPTFLKIVGIGNENLDMFKCAIVHDFEYSNESDCTRFEADEHLFKNLRTFEISFTQSAIIYDGVRLFGETHYQGRRSKD